MQSNIWKAMAKAGIVACAGVGLTMGLASCEDSPNGHSLPAEFSGTYIPISGNNIFDGDAVLGSIILNQGTPSNGEIKNSALGASASGYVFVKGKITGKSDTEATFWVELTINGEKVKITGTLTLADGTVYMRGKISGAINANVAAKRKGAATPTPPAAQPTPQPKPQPAPPPTYPPLSISAAINPIFMDYVGVGIMMPLNPSFPIETILTASGGSGKYQWSIGNSDSNESRYNPAVTISGSSNNAQVRIHTVKDSGGSGADILQFIIVTDTATGAQKTHGQSVYFSPFGP
jgi:hypothetical protein